MEEHSELSIADTSLNPLTGLIAMTKHPTKLTEGQKAFVSSQFKGTIPHGRDAWYQEHEVAGCILSIVRRQREMKAVAEFTSLLYSVQYPIPWNSATPIYG